MTCALAAVYAVHGEPSQVLRIVEEPVREPAPDEIVLRMEAAAMHIADLRAIRGLPPFEKLGLPRSPGFEGIGRVAHLGSATTQLRIGDRVFAPLGSGTFRESLTCKAADVMPAPEGDALQLSLLTVNAATAYVLLEDFVTVAAGEWLIQNAANSSCGRYLISLAQARGAQTINVVRRDGLSEELHAIGADIVLSDGPELAERVARATAGALPRLGIDAIGGAATQRLAECLAPGGLIASYGSMSGQRCELDFYLLFARGVRLQGVALSRQMQQRTREEQREIYAELAERIAGGSLAARIAAVYPLEQNIQACEHSARCGAQREGKVIVDLR